MKILSMAWRNVFRYWSRSLITTTAMAFAGFIMILFASLMAGMAQTSERNAVAMNLGDIQIHAPGYREDPDLYNRIEHADPLLLSIRQHGYTASGRLYAFGLAAAGSASAGVELRGINVQAEKTVTEIHQHVLHGQWLDAADPNGVVIGRKLARTLGIHPGGEIVFLGQAADGSMANELYHVRGILKSVADNIDRSGLYMNETAFRQLMQLPEGVHEIAVLRTDRSRDLDHAASEIATLAAPNEALSWRLLMPIIASLLDMMDSQLIIMLLITYTAVATVILNAILMSVFERIREFGIMKAIGTPPTQVAALIFLEAILQALAASALALIFGWLAADHFQTHGIDLSALASGASFGGIAMDPVWHAQVTPTTLLLPIGVLLLMTAIAVIYPALKAALIRPVQAIHYR